MPKTNGQYQPVDFFIALLSDDGTQSGVTNFNADYSVTSVEAFFQAPAGSIHEITELQIAIAAGAKINQGDYGNVTGPLTVGVDVRATLNGTDVSLLNTVLKTNHDLINFGGSTSSQVIDFAGTADTLTTSFKAVDFAPGPRSTALRLNGDLGDRVRIVLSDNFTPINQHTFLIRGFS